MAKNFFKKLTSILVLGGTAINLLLFGAIVSYCLLNFSGHTAFNFSQWIWRWPFIALLLIGIIEFLINWRVKYRAGDLAILVSIIGMAFLWYLDFSNTMLNYEVWLKRGMPEPPTGRLFFLCAFIVIQITTTITVARKISFKDTNAIN